MSKRLAILIIITMLLYLVAAQCAFAKLVIYLPQDMIESSSLIVDATVIDDPTRYVNKVDSLKVNAILKGTTTSPTITVSKSLYQAMPSPGTRAMVLLQGVPSKYEHASYMFTGDVNNIGIIKGGKVVDIFNGVNVKGTDRIAVYNNFYQEKTKEQQLAHRQNVLITGMAVAFAGVLLGVFWLYRIRTGRSA